MVKINEGLKDVKVGDTVYYYNANHRIYEDDQGNKTHGPNERLMWIPIKIVGETPQTFLVEMDGYINKVTGELKGRYYGSARYGWSIVLTKQGVEDTLWLRTERYKMSDMVKDCTDVNKLKQIQSILEAK